MGFTLVELAIVIAVLVLSAAMLVPVIGEVRQMGIRTRCAANLHVIATAVGNYSTEHRWALPRHYRDADVVFDTFMMAKWLVQKVLQLFGHLADGNTPSIP